MYAINIADLTRHADVAPLLLGDATPNKVVVRVERDRLDGDAVVLECPPERARAVIRVLRRADEARRQYPTRVYVQGPRGGWRRLSGKQSVD